MYIITINIIFPYVPVFQRDFASVTLFDPLVLL